jgi:hypothetical protein
MWLILISWCAGFDGGQKCAAYTPPQFFPDEAVCNRYLAELGLGLIDKLAEMGGEPFWLWGDCMDTSPGSEA